MVYRKRIAGDWRDVETRNEQQARRLFGNAGECVLLRSMATMGAARGVCASETASNAKVPDDAHRTACWKRQNLQTEIVASQALAVSA